MVRLIISFPYVITLIFAKSAYMHTYVMKCLPYGTYYFCFFAVIDKAFSNPWHKKEIHILERTSYPSPIDNLSI